MHVATFMLALPRRVIALETRWDEGRTGCATSARRQVWRGLPIDGRLSKIHALELEKGAAAPVFREAVRTGLPGIPAEFVRMYIRFTLSRYLNVGVNASLEECEREVLTHPVFLVQSEMKEGA